MNGQINEWVWIQDRSRSLFNCITTNHLVCYEHTTDEKQHDIELANFKKKYPEATVHQYKKKNSRFDKT